RGRAAERGRVRAPAAWIRLDELRRGRARPNALRRALHVHRRRDLNGAAALESDRPGCEVPRPLRVGPVVRVEEVRLAEPALDLLRRHAELDLPDADAGVDRRLDSGRTRDADEREDEHREQPPHAGAIAYC